MKVYAITRGGSVKHSVQNYKLMGDPYHYLSFTAALYYMKAFSFS